MRRTSDPFEAHRPNATSDLARSVLDVVDAIPRGRVMSYGDIAAHLGCGPRQVARVMTERGDEAAWWRVLRSDGTCAPEVRSQQMRKLRAEGVAMRGDARVDMEVARYFIEE